MYNVHIGFPKITFSNLSFVGDSVKLSDPTETYLLPHRTFRKSLRPVVNNYRTIRKQPDALTPAKMLFKNLARYKTVSVSEPGLLGASRELLYSERAVQRGAARIAAFSELLSDADITFHIAITSQLDYLTEIFAESVKDVLSNKRPFSWGPIIQILVNAAPERRFVVWNFERPERIEEQFLCELLGQTLFYSGMNSQLNTQYLRGKRPKLPSIIGLEREFELYDDMFENDINSIKRIDGVLLIGPD